MEKTSVLAKLKQGDETSFTFVYDHYWRKVYRFSEIYLRRRGNKRGSTRGFYQIMGIACINQRKQRHRRITLYYDS